MKIMLRHIPGILLWFLIGLAAVVLIVFRGEHAPTGIWLGLIVVAIIAIRMLLKKVEEYEDDVEENK